MNRRKIKITEEIAPSEPRSRRLLVTRRPKCYLSTCPSSDFSPHALRLLLQEKEEKEKKKKIRSWKEGEGEREEARIKYCLITKHSSMQVN